MNGTVINGAVSKRGRPRLNNNNNTDDGDDDREDINNDHNNGPNNARHNNAQNNARINAQNNANNNHSNNNNNNERISHLLDLSNGGIFEKVNIEIANKQHEYCAILNWFEFSRTFVTRPYESMPYQCIVCNRSVRAYLGKPGNLIKHLETHNDSKIWLKEYNSNKNMTSINKNPNNTVPSVVKFFITSNLALLALKNPYLRELTRINIGKYALTKRIVPNLIEKMNSELEKKFQAATCIHLMVDIWSSYGKAQHLGVGAIMTKKLFAKEIVVIQKKSFLLNIILFRFDKYHLINIISHH